MSSVQRIPFTKHWSDIPTQISVLKSRNLIVRDEALAAEFLAYINYYRFTGYCLRFMRPPDGNGLRLFDRDVSFEDIVDLCGIDRDLRDVFSRGLELIEISVRAAIADEFGRAHDAFGHLDSSNFAPAFGQPSGGESPVAETPFSRWRDKIRSEVKRSRELFVAHFKKSYSEYPDLPIWMTCEIASFGSISRLYEGMKRADQRSIANRYGLQPGDMVSWLHALVYARNVCAHHARLWDRSLSIMPSVPPGRQWEPVRAAPNNSLYVAAMILNWMLAHGSIDKTVYATWKRDLAAVLDVLSCKFPLLMGYTGFPQGWKKLPLWWQV